MKFLVCASLRASASLPENPLALFQKTAAWTDEHMSDGAFDCA